MPASAPPLMLPAAMRQFLTSRSPAPGQPCSLHACRSLEPFLGRPVLTAGCLPQAAAGLALLFHERSESCFGDSRPCPSCHLQIKMRSQRLPEVTPWSTEVTSVLVPHSQRPSLLTCGPAQPPGVALCEGENCEPHEILLLPRALESEALSGH